MEAALQVRPDGDAGEGHVGRHHHVARFRLDDPRHRHADGGQVGRLQFGLVEDLLDDVLDQQQDLFRAAGSRRRLPLFAQDDSRFADQRALAFVPPISTPR